MNGSVRRRGAGWEYYYRELNPGTGKWRRSKGGLHDDQGFVFTRADGRPFDPNDFSPEFDRRIRRLGLPRIRRHDLRHTWATLALQTGIHPKIVSERLGHSTIAITLDIYSHVTPTLQREDAEAVALRFSAGRSTADSAVWGTRACLRNSNVTARLTRGPVRVAHRHSGSVWLRFPPGRTRAKTSFDTTG